MIELRGLGYIVVESTNTAAWRQYGEQVLGMMASDAPDGGLALKMDERVSRIHIVNGEQDRYLASGWELAGEQAFQAAQDSLRKRGVPYQLADSAMCALRHVQQMLTVTDPSGNRHELYWGVKSDFRRFTSPIGVAGFVTGELGLGHVVLPAPDFDATYGFLKDVLGFGLSDMFRMRFTPDPAEPEKRIYFLHCANGRHHSLGIFDMPSASGCVHAMVEVQSMDEVGRALDRVRQHGVKMSATLGRHCNDRMTSFYMKTPGGFDMEYGHGGLVVDWEQHSVYEATAVSLWGHDFSIGFQ
ncbi:VOC family protein [Pseudoduganella ginsengisoli]|uniref:Biphenyl 2,3-dioxygenase n=1 Tax=Pseudoduganella ginsengisoli TaxID=1462440 RepID=A0A6L6PY60_9BURK|nr:VOC family protein [Pseudoduganella ginsengisoli]MTW01642.1 biphenyl 2,3-dioxygenase [Pseudoduganella ginsengisoli]